VRARRRAARRRPAATIRSQVTLPLRLGGGPATTARVFTFDGLIDGREHLAIGLGDRALPVAPSRATAPLVRLHSECLTGDVLGSERCDCGPQLAEAVARIEAEGGYLLYLRQEGRGIGLYAKLDAYLLQDSGLDTYDANLALGYPADERDYTVAAQMLDALGVGRVALLGNNPDKAAQLERLGVVVTERVPTGVHLSAANARYLATKATKGGHTLDLTTPNVSAAGRPIGRPAADKAPVDVPDGSGGSDRQRRRDAHRIHVVAAGRAARRSGAIGSPQDSQRP
jgi:GTP cyclohydrolase II